MASSKVVRKVTVTEFPDEVDGKPQQQPSQPQQQQQKQHSDKKERDLQEKFKQSWKLPPRYEVKQLLGQGAYGSVASARDLETKRQVAIKQAKHLLDDLIDAKRLLREAAILGSLNHPNVCKIYDLTVPANLVKFNEIYMVLELCDSDLKKLCRAEVHLDPIHVTSLLYNLLVGLNYLHTAGIWHRDLKPANCLVNEDCSVKICDFGLSRAVGGENGAHAFEKLPDKAASTRALTGHVVTRWYRAPELILLQEGYTESIDVWSVGCIYAELLGMLKGTDFKDRAPLFPGHSCYPLSPHENHKTDAKYYTKGTRDQLSMICGLLGSPSKEDIDQISGEDARCYMRCFPRKEGTGIKAKYDKLEPVGSELLEQMLVFSAAKRITAADALKHKLFNKVRDRKREAATASSVCLDFERDECLDEKRLRMYFLREVRRYHPEVPQM